MVTPHDHGKGKPKDTTLLHCFNHVWALSWNSDREWWDLLFLTNIAGTQAKRFSAFLLCCADGIELVASALMTHVQAALSNQHQLNSVPKQ